MIPRAESLIKMCEKDGHRILIPTVVLGELLAGVPVESQPDFVRHIQRRFLLAPFDAAAALVYGRLWQAHKVSVIPQAKKDGVEHAVIKADHMIAAVAIARKCDYLCTIDKALIRFSQEYVNILHLSSVIVQPPLLEP
jgi:predicted nucleic acid-binding protein